jgi:hypothetical protein
LVLHQRYFSTAPPCRHANGLKSQQRLRSISLPGKFEQREARILVNREARNPRLWAKLCAPRAVLKRVARLIEGDINHLFAAGFDTHYLK